MLNSSELRNALDSIRKCGPQVIKRNGLELAVVESWLKAVERELNKEPVDWASIHVCVEVLDRWVSAVPELKTAHEAFSPLCRGGDRALGGFHPALSSNVWFRPTTHPMK
jgi:hypothetical protein